MPDPTRHRAIIHQITATGLRVSTGHGSLPILGTAVSVPPNDHRDGGRFPVISASDCDVLED